jgi:hypothetical protein
MPANPEVDAWFAELEPRANGPGGPLTIADQIDYTFVSVKPAFVLIPGISEQDCLPVGMRYVPGSYSASTDVPLAGPGVLPTHDTDPWFFSRPGHR